MSGRKLIQIGLAVAVAAALGVAGTALYSASPAHAAASAKPGPRTIPAPKHPHARLVELQAQINALFASVTTLSDQVAATQDSLQALHDQAAALQQQIDSHTGDIALLQTQLADTNTVIAELQQNLDQQAQAIALKQNIVSGVCPNGVHAASINADGSIVCTPDSGVDGVHQFTVWASSGIPPFGVVSVTPSCPDDGSILTGGGYILGPNTAISQSFAGGRTWYASASTNIFGGSLSVEAICVSTT